MYINWKCSPLICQRKMVFSERKWIDIVKLLWYEDRMRRHSDLCTSILRLLVRPFPKVWLTSFSKELYILTPNKYHPYKLHLISDILRDYYDKRFSFCEERLKSLEQNIGIPLSILLSDEPNFCINGVINRHNFNFLKSPRKPQLNRWIFRNTAFQHFKPWK